MHALQQLLSRKEVTSVLMTYNGTWSVEELLDKWLQGTSFKHLYTAVF